MNCRGCRRRFLPLPNLSRKIEGDSVRRVTACVSCHDSLFFLCVCVCVIPSYISVSHAKKHNKRNLTIDLFSLYVLFSQIREFAF